MMNESDKIKFAKIMAGMADNFRDTITKDGMAMRFEMLKGFSIDQVEAAAKKIMATRKYNKMPPIAEFLEAMGSGPPNIEDTATVQATEIVNHLKRHGIKKYPEMDDPITKYLMTRRWPYGKWASEILESEIKWWVKEFTEAYRSYSSQPPEHIQIEMNQKLKGLIENIG